MAEPHFRDGSQNNHKSLPKSSQGGDTSCFSRFIGISTVSGKSRAASARLPSWFTQKIPKDINFIKNRLRDFENAKLSTVCKSAHCPNINYCFEHNSVTFMILGDTCSRNCNFCAVRKGRLRPLELGEPYNLALTIRNLNLQYSVITSVTRDDLYTERASHYARSVYAIRSLNPGKRIELLIPDFRNSRAALSLVIASAPDIIAHNMETVERLYLTIRPQAGYRRSLEVLKNIKEIGFAGFTKSGIMLGFGEHAEEVLQVFADLKEARCDIITLGQYLAPSLKHAPVKEFIPLEQFEFYRHKALEIGFKAVFSGPLVRSSYKAEEVYAQISA